MATKKADHRPSLGTTFLAAQFIDLLWPFLLMAGLERVEVDPGNTAFTPLRFVSYPFSHSLTGVLIWSVLFGGVYYALKRNGRTALLVALLVLTTVREPPRRLERGEAASTAPKVSEVVGYLWRHRAVFVPLFAGFAGIVITGYAFNVWWPAYFMRVHGFMPAQVGLLYAVGFGIFGTLCVLTGGAWSDRVARRGKADAPIRVSIWSAIIQGPLFIGAYLAPSAALAGGLFVVALFFGSIYGGLQAAAIQALTPNRMRGQVAALYLTIANMIGLGLAPTWTAWMTENVFGGPQDVGKSLALTTVISLVVGVLLLLVAMGPARRQISALR